MHIHFADVQCFKNKNASLSLRPHTDIVRDCLTMLRPEFNLVCFKSLKYDSQSNKVCKFFWKYVNSIQGRDSKMGSEKLFYFCQLCIQYLRFANLAQIAELLMVKQPSKVFWKKNLFLIIHRETLALKSLFIKLQTWRGATLLKRIGAFLWILQNV